MDDLGHVGSKGQDPLGLPDIDAAPRGIDHGFSAGLRRRNDQKEDAPGRQRAPDDKRISQGIQPYVEIL